VTADLFIAGLAFTDNVLLEEAKVGVLADSLVAGLAEYVFILPMIRGQMPGNTP
jgi:Na+/H+ antiporter NhaA